MALSFDKQLQTYVDLIIRVGLNLHKGQTLWINAPVEAPELTRRVAEAAYKAGAYFVNVIWLDDAVICSRLAHASKDSLTHFPKWYKDAFNIEMKRGDALLSIRSTDPEAFKGQDPSAISTIERVGRAEFKPRMKKVLGSEVNWCVVNIPSQGWAKRVFPKLSPDKAVGKLWAAIFAAVRADKPNAVKVWQKHLKALEQRRAYLDEKQYDALHYKAPGTDLKVGLVEGHLWLGGFQDTQDGITYVANLPTEEVFTMPHKNRVDGVVRSSKPLAHAGTIIDPFELTFRDGAVVKANAKRGQNILEKLLETDEGAKHLGEVALVPYSSPISQSGILFLSTLFDENAASHFALGSAYRINVKGGTSMTDKQAAKVGVNSSLTHVDFMIGSNKMDIDGVRNDGTREAVMRKGEWAV
ncbi:MAG: aminopeptidase [Trueperaceae bacterium]